MVVVDVKNELQALRDTGTSNTLPRIPDPPVINKPDRLTSFIYFKFLRLHIDLNSFELRLNVGRCWWYIDKRWKTRSCTASG